MNRRAAISVAMAVLFLAGNCAAGQSLAVWCVGESAKIRPDTTPQQSNLTWNAGTRTVTLGSARNEYVAFQIAVRSLNDALRDVTVVTADLKGPGSAVIPAGNIDLFVEHYLNVTVSSRSGTEGLLKHCTPGEHPTQMVPFRARKYGAPFTVGAGRNQPVWVDVYVPADTAPGVYNGIVKVTIGAEVAAEIKVALTVWNFSLPHETHFRTYLYTGPENLRWGHRLPGDMNDPAWHALEDRYFQMAHQHRLNFHPCAGSGLEEVLVRYRKYYDGTGFRERVGRGVGQSIAFITPEGGNEQDFKSFARKIVDECEKKRFRTTVVSYVWDEPHSPEDFAESKRRCKWIREAAGNKLLTFIATPQWQRYDAGDVNIFSEPAAEDIPKIVARGDAVWAVNGGYAAGPYVDSPGYGGRSIALMNWRMKLGGWQFWDCCYWVDRQNRKHKDGGRWVRDMTQQQINADPARYLHDLWNDPLNFDESRKKGYPLKWSIRINGDGVLFYPGHDVGIDGPIASFAMKSLRRGAQDYEYLWLLRQKGREREADAVLATVCPAAGKWNDDPESWDRARLAWAALLEK